MNRITQYATLMFSLLVCVTLLAACGGDSPTATPPLASPTAVALPSTATVASIASPPTSTAVGVDLPTVTAAPLPTSTNPPAAPTATAVDISFPTATAASPTNPPAPTAPVIPTDTPAPAAPTATTVSGQQGGLSINQVEQAAKDGRYFIYDISTGDTLANVAQATGMEVATLAQLNKLEPTAPLTPGRTLLVQTVKAGDFSFMPRDSIIAALGKGLPRYLFPSSDTLAKYDFRIALHRLKLALPASGATQPGYILVFYTTKDSVIGERGDEDLSVIDPAFALAGGSLAPTVQPKGGLDFYSTSASGITELVKTFKGAKSSAQDLYGQLAVENQPR